MAWLQIIKHTTGATHFKIMKTFTLKFTEAELETIASALDDYMAYADDEFASADDLIGGLPVADRINSINDKITTVLN